MHNIKDKLINGEKEHKSLEELIRDSIRFTFKKTSYYSIFRSIFIYC